VRIFAIICLELYRLLDIHVLYINKTSSPSVAEKADSTALSGIAVHAACWRRLFRTCKFWQIACSQYVFNLFARCNQRIWFMNKGSWALWIKERYLLFLVRGSRQTVCQLEIIYCMLTTKAGEFESPVWSASEGREDQDGDNDDNMETTTTTTTTAATTRCVHSAYWWRYQQLGLGKISSSATQRK